MKDEALSVCFPFFGLFVGAAVTFLLSRLPYSPPYTVVIFLFGFFLAIVASVLNQQQVDNALVKSIFAWENIDPELLLYSLLPPLLFGEAMTLNFHQVKQVFWPAVLLAGPGAVFGAYFQGLFVFYCLPHYGWNWTLSFIFGTILCATDPVSVVAMLKSVASSSTSTIRLTYLVIGEALMNDASALVIFEVLLSKHSTVDEIVVYFVKVIFISPCIGGAIGLGTVMGFRLANRRVKDDDTTTQVALTISCAYISFFLAQYTLGLSGVLSCCSAGLVLAYLGPPLILQPEAMEVVWHTLEWVGNTLIFMIAGLIVGSKSIQNVVKEDFAAIIIVYCSMFVIRTVMLLICFPAVKAMSNLYTIKDLVFSSFGGLRGAISLALVLVLQQHTDEMAGPDEASFPVGDVRRAMFILCGVVTLTIAVNGTLAGWVLVLLGITHSSASTDEQIIFHYVQKRIKRSTRRTIFELKEELPPHNTPLVWRMCSVLNDGSDDFDYQYQVAQREHLERVRDLDMRHRGAEQGELQEGNSATSDSGEVDEAKKGLDNDEDEERPLALKPQDIVGPRPVIHRRLHHQHRGLGRDDSNTSLVDMAVEACINGNMKTDPDDDREGKRDDAGGRDSSTAHFPGHYRRLHHQHRGLGREDSNTSLVDMAVEACINGNATADLDNDIEQHSATAGRERRGRVVQGDDQGEGSADNPPSRQRFNSNFGGTTRDLNSDLQDDLLAKFRNVFLDVVRRNYWKQIFGGRIPRGSPAALILLNSIDVGLETSHTPGLQDWDAIERSLTVTWLERILDYFKHFKGIDAWHAFVQEQREETEILVFTSFVVAHEYAQKKIPFYFGETEYIDTPEEALIVNESIELVEKAQKKLALIDPDDIKFHITKQATRIVLHTQEDMILHYKEEGILSVRDATTLLEGPKGPSADLQRLDRYHNHLTSLTLHSLPQIPLPSGNEVI